MKSMLHDTDPKLSIRVGAVVTLSVAAALSCTPELPLPDPVAHRAEVEAWRQRRMESVKQPDGWLSVVGLFWLEQGANGFGSDTTNPIVFPGEDVPPYIGTFILNGAAVRMDVAPGVTVTQEGEPVTSLALSSDVSGKPAVAQLGALRWYVIERQNQVAIRLKDTANAAIERFDGMETFPIDIDWIIPAHFDRYDPPRVIEVPNVTGLIAEQPSPGAVVFRVDGKKYRLDVTGDPDAESFFITFGDRTNGLETYGGGRFLSVAAPDEHGRMFIDFNLAYNPPCVFTAFATCPLPPHQNRLSMSIEAGEKMYHDAAH